MVGDNYEWEVVAPQALGMCGIWYDPFDAGVPANATAKPTRIIKRPRRTDRVADGAGDQRVARRHADRGAFVDRLHLGAARPSS